jgi:hypothetical protein
MENTRKQRWQELCAEAAVEHDHQKLLALVAEISRLLEEKEHQTAEELQVMKNRRTRTAGGNA